MNLIHKYTYVNPPYRWLVWPASFIIWLVFDLLGLFSVALVCVGFLYLFRRDSKVFLKRVKNVQGPAGLVLAPVNGEVVEIKHAVDHIFFGKNLTQIRMVVPLFREMGIYLPSKSEVSNFLIGPMKRFWRLSEGDVPDQSDDIFSGVLLKLKDDRGSKVGLQMMRCVYGGNPQISVLPGDRGAEAANIGFLPLGGTVLLYLPQESEVIVKENDILKAGETVIAGIEHKGESDVRLK